MFQAELECRFCPDGRLVSANPAYCDYFNCSRLEDYPLPPHLSQSCEGLPRVNWSGLTPDQKHINHEVRMVTVTGESEWHQWYNEGIFDDQGTLIEIRAVGRDITRYKLIEARLQQQINREKALNRLIERIRQSLDIDAIFTVATAELRQVLGCDRTSIYKFTPDWGGYFLVESVQEGWRPLVQEDIKTVWVDTYLQEQQGGRYRHQETFAVDDIYLSGHSPCHLDILEQFQVRAYVVVPIFRQDQLWGLLSAYHNRDPHNWQPEDVSLLSQVAHHLGIALQQVELLEQFKHAKNAADQANQAKSTFLSRMSHELRTPLNAIIGYAQFLLRYSNASPEHQSYLNTINASGEHLLRLINDILSMAKIEAGQVNVVMTEFNLRDTLEQLIDMLLVKASEKGISLQMELAPHLPAYIRTDQAKLQQILINLLSNGIKFTQMGSVKLTVRLADPHLSDVLCFSVIDTGCGIAPEQAQQLFQPFSQTDAGREIPDGTGLGLAISHHFAHLLQGTLVLVETSPRGSTFELTLPVEGVEAVELKPYIPMEQVVGLAEDQPPVRILVAEDQATSRQLLVKILETVGFQVRAVSNGADAITQWQVWDPQLIFMDLQMPVLDGYEATRRIKATADPAPVILALSASAFDEDEQVALESQCDGFLRKPIREAELFGAIAQFIGVRYRHGDPPAPSCPLSAVTADDLRVMPPEWLDRLYQAALTVNNRTLSALIAEIPTEHAALAQTLNRWVRTFRCDKIVDLMEHTGDTKPTTP